MSAEKIRLKQAGWKKWGPYVSDRQWGTVREDYSSNGDAWSFISHDMARSKAYRWGEDGIAGICDDHQLLCFAVALWNKKDPIIKERYFGLSNPEGNHGEDVKELYYYLDSTPTHSYMKMLYKYPQQQFPYSKLVDENRKRSRDEPEYELLDTGIFDTDNYFDVKVEYAKDTADDILIRITVHNRGSNAASINVLPSVWYRNTWSWGYDDYQPRISAGSEGIIELYHRDLGEYWLFAENPQDVLFCDNETNVKKLYNVDESPLYPKDGINDQLVNGASTVNPRKYGTKAAVNYDLHIEGGQHACIRLRLTKKAEAGFTDFDQLFELRKAEADEFYDDIQSTVKDNEARLIQRQAFAGMLWSKQFYYYNIYQWLSGDPAGPAPPSSRWNMRNHNWEHLTALEIISMPDKWEYPWFASWDLAFHCIAFSKIDPVFAKRQLVLLTREWYMHPNGQLPAYEWEFNDTNPPIHALATWKVYLADKEANSGEGDTDFLERVFHKLMLNFTWWVNRKDKEGKNIFQGGFLGLDNIGVFDRNAPLPGGGYIEQADGTSWMAMYSLNLLRISTELAKTNKVYSDVAAKFFDHFMYIAGALANIGQDNVDLWDEEDNFFYDQLRFPGCSTEKLKVRSIVGLIPLFAVEVMDEIDIHQSPVFSDTMKWFYDNRPDLSKLVSRWNEKNSQNKHLISLLRGYRMKKLLRRMLDETEFLSDYGVRSVSRYYLEHPYHLRLDGHVFSVKYTPAESDSGLFGGNSNWRGPIWMPINFLLIESLRKFYDYYGDEFKVECPVNSGNLVTLNEVADELSRRLSAIFLKDKDGRRPVFGHYDKMQTDPQFKDHILFYEYFDGDNGRGVGASHQTGWTGLVACFF
jgi:hypothetical protein